VVRSCIRDGLVGGSIEMPVQLTFRDLATLRMIKRLAEQGLPMTSVRRELKLLAMQLSAEQTLSELPVEVRGTRLVVRGRIETVAGQLDLFSQAATTRVLDGQVHALPVAVKTSDIDRTHATIAAQVVASSETSDSGFVLLQPVPLVTADEWFARALEVEDSDPRASMDAYRRGLRLRPDASESWVNLGRLLADNNDGPGAAACFRTAMDLDPADPTAHYNLGVVAQDDGRSSEAIELYRRAIMLDPCLAEAHYNLATLFDQTGDPRAAIRHINEYRKLTKGLK
jgi:uncharacterized protein HemY